MNKLPSPAQRDSVILLPLYCLLETSLDTFKNLSSEEQLYVALGVPADNPYAQFWALVPVAVLVFTVAVLYDLIIVCFSISDKKISDEIGTTRVAWTPVIFKFCCLCISLGLIIFNWYTIVSLRSWINGSIWLIQENGKNPE